MGNMSYCRFQNTNGDLEDCLDHINDELGGAEKEHRDRLIETCKDIIATYETPEDQNQ